MQSSDSLCTCFDADSCISALLALLTYLLTYLHTGSFSAAAQHTTKSQLEKLLHHASKSNFGLVILTFDLLDL